MKSYKVLHDTWLRGRPYASGSFAILGDEDAAGYMRAGLVEGDVVVEAAPVAEVAEVAEVTEKPASKPAKKAAK